MANANPMLANRKTDWKKCCLCQIDKNNDALVSPPTHHVPQHDGYTMLVTNVPLFREINQMPMILDPARLDEGGGIEAGQVSHKLSTNVQQHQISASKRQSDAQSNEIDEGLTNRRRTSGDIFCDEISTESGLMTMNLNTVHECGQTLNDGKLLTKLSGGNAIAQELKYHYVCLSGFYNRERSHLKALEKE